MNPKVFSSQSNGRPDFFIVANFEGPDPDIYNQGLQGDYRGSRTSTFLVKGLQATLHDHVHNFLKWKLHLNDAYFERNKIEVRVPHPNERGAGVVDNWHHDNGYTESKFWHILWTDVKSTEFKVKHRSTTQVPVKPGDLVLFRNDLYLHRRPPLSEREASRRWFMRVFVPDSDAFTGDIEKALDYGWEHFNPTRLTDRMLPPIPPVGYYHKSVPTAYTYKDFFS